MTKTWKVLRINVNNVIHCGSNKVSNNTGLSDIFLEKGSRFLYY